MISVDLPKQVEDELRRFFGAGLDEAVRQALIAEGFRESRLSIGEAAELLGMSIDQAHGFMRRRGIEQSGPTLSEIERETDLLRRRLGGRAA